MGESRASRLAAIVIAVGLGLGLAACSGYAESPPAVPQPTVTTRPLDDSGVVKGCEYRAEGGWRETAARALCESQGLPYPGDEVAPATEAWSCWYEPTMNENWHDDVVCQRATESFRPELLAGQFVTEDDMRRAAADYEAELNAGG